jgi:N-acylneuraminate cytidylyltransferase
MQPLLPLTLNGVPWHSCQMAALPDIYVQNASLEIAWSRVIAESRTIAGQSVIPFVSEGLEGFDINVPEDWLLAEHLLASGEARLPPI